MNVIFLTFLLYVLHVNCLEDSGFEQRQLKKTNHTKTPVLDTDENSNSDESFESLERKVMQEKERFYEKIEKERNKYMKRLKKEEIHFVQETLKLQEKISKEESKHKENLSKFEKKLDKKRRKTHRNHTIYNNEALNEIESKTQYFENNSNLKLYLQNQLKIDIQNFWKEEKYKSKISKDINQTNEFDKKKYNYTKPLFLDWLLKKVPNDAIVKEASDLLNNQSSAAYPDLNEEDLNNNKMQQNRLLLFPLLQYLCKLHPNCTALSSNKKNQTLLVSSPTASDVLQNGVLIDNTEIFINNTDLNPEYLTNDLVDESTFISDALGSSQSLSSTDNAPNITLQTDNPVSAISSANNTDEITDINNVSETTMPAVEANFIDAHSTSTQHTGYDNQQSEQLATLFIENKTEDLNVATSLGYNRTDENFYDTEKTNSFTNFEKTTNNYQNVYISNEVSKDNETNIDYLETEQSFLYPYQPTSSINTKFTEKTDVTEEYTTYNKGLWTSASPNSVAIIYQTNNEMEHETNQEQIDHDAVVTTEINNNEELISSFVTSTFSLINEINTNNVVSEVNYNKSQETSNIQTTDNNVLIFTLDNNDFSTTNLTEPGLDDTQKNKVNSKYETTTNVLNKDSTTNINHDLNTNSFTENGLVGTTSIILTQATDEPFSTTNDISQSEISTKPTFDSSAIIEEDVLEPFTSQGQISSFTSTENNRHTSDQSSSFPGTILNTVVNTTETISSEQNIIENKTEGFALLNDKSTEIVFSQINEIEGTDETKTDIRTDDTTTENIKNYLFMSTTDDDLKNDQIFLNGRPMNITESENSSEKINDLEVDNIEANKITHSTESLILNDMMNETTKNDSYDSNHKEQEEQVIDVSTPQFQNNKDTTTSNFEYDFITTQISQLHDSNTENSVMATTTENLINTTLNSTSTTSNEVSSIDDESTESILSEKSSSNSAR